MNVLFVRSILLIFKIVPLFFAFSFDSAKVCLIFLQDLNSAIA